MKPCVHCGDPKGIIMVDDVIEPCCDDIVRYGNTENEDFDLCHELLALAPEPEQ